MGKTGFIIKVRSKGHDYFYLRKSVRVETEKGSIPRNKNIYSFGSKIKAIDKLKEWEIDIKKMPENLKILGYDLKDVLSWLEQIESK